MKKTAANNEALIRAYGIYWVRNAVNWNSGRLPGLRMSSKLTSRNSEKRERRVNAWSQQGVYALYSDAKLVYVGLADSEKGIGARLRDHQTKPRLIGRWDSFCWFGINGFDEKGDVRRVVESISTSASALIRTMELLLILAADPLMNRASGRFAGAERINQDEMIEQPTNSELKSLLDEIKKKIGV